MTGRSRSLAPSAGKKPGGLRLVLGALVVLLALVAGLLVFVAIPHAPRAPSFRADRRRPEIPQDQNGAVWLNTHAPSERRELPAGLTTLLNSKQTPGEEGALWAQIQGSRAAIEAELARPASVAWLAAVAHARRMPHFAEPCDYRTTYVCEMRGVLGAHRMHRLAVLSKALSGDLVSATDDAVAQLAQDRELATSAHHVFPVVASITLLERDALLLGVLAKVTRDELASTDLTRAQAANAALVKLASADRLLDTSAFSVPDMVIDDYYDSARELRSLMRTSLPPKLWFLYDEGATIDLLTAHYEQLVTWARHPTASTAPRFADPTAPTLWWLHNAHGKQMLSLSMPDIPAIILRHAEHLAELDARRAALRVLTGMPMHLR